MQIRSVIRNRWTIASAAAFALIVGGSPMLIFTFGVLLKSISDTTGWSRADTSTALSFMLCATALVSPIVGMLVDRFGVRRPLVTSILVTAAVLALISTIHTLWAFWLTFFLLGVVSPGLQPVLYSKVVVEWFDKERGVALGLINAGQGVGGMLLPLFTGLLLADFGWRGAYVGLAVLLLVITLPGALFIIRENPDAIRERRALAAGRNEPGLSWREMLRSRPFWLIIISAFTLSMAINGTVPHMVPLLTDRGYQLAAAVGLMSTLGLAGMAGRIVTGFLVDKFFAPFVAVVVFTLAACGMAVIWLNPTAVPVVVGAILIGAGIGAEIDLMSYLTSRYFARHVFASVYGIVFFALILGQALGAYVMGQTFAAVHSYGPALGVFTAAVLGTGLLSLAYGPYTFPPAGHDPEATRGEPAGAGRPRQAS